MRQQKYSLTHEQFEVLRQKLKHSNGKRFESGNIDAAYRVMVTNESAQSVADSSDMSRQNLHRVVRDLWAIFHDVDPPSRVLQRRQKSIKPPSTWVRVAATLPPDMAKSVQDMEAEALERLKTDSKIKDSEK